MSDHLRIVLDARATTPHFPGVSRATLGLLAGLAEIEHSHHVAVLSWNENPLPGHAAFSDPRFTRIPVRAAPLGLVQQWTLPLLSRSLRPDLWHAPFYVRPFAGIPRPVVTIYDVIGRVVPGALPSPRSRLFFELAIRLSLRGAAQIITSSAATKRDLIAEYGVEPSCISVIPLAADRSFAPQPATAIRALRERYALPPRYLLYFGSNKPHKNQPLLVRAFARVQTNVPLVIAGAWDQRFDEPKQLVAELGLSDRVRFIHDVPAADVPALLSGALAFVFPSRYEGFGLPPLEAMACGTPVIASNSSSLPEVVGDAGLLVEPEVAPLAEALQWLVDDPVLREDLAARGLERACGFTWAETARQTLAVYERVGLGS
ncbi:MAG: glycosyltransferase family 4 protein [Chloroflexi bacterium]|nr:glycosyltransferase family 4 protein [Chloroflexota bacterium]